MSVQHNDRVSIVMPEDVKYIINTIENNGYEAYAVGGCVRDTLLGKEPTDWDITTSAKPLQVKEMFKRTIDTGIKHGTVTVMLHKKGYEITTYRIDGEYEDGRHPSSVEFSTTLKDDLMRRDFTINAMAYNDRNGLVDEFDGIKDLDNHIIRCVGDPRQRFEEDALRMMRAIRFCAQLGFTIEKSTYSSIQKLAPTISKISMERIQTELSKTLMSNNPEKVEEYSKTGILKHVLPICDTNLSGKYKVHTSCMIRYSDRNLILKYAGLLSVCTDEQAKEVLRALRLDNNTINIVTRLVKYSRDTIEENEPAVRTAIHKYGTELMPYMIKHQKALLKTKEYVTGIIMNARRNHINTIERMYEDIVKRGDCISIKDLDIDGNDLMEYGLKGKNIGIMLEQLLKVVLENPRLNDKQTLIALIEHLQ